MSSEHAEQERSAENLIARAKDVARGRDPIEAQKVSLEILALWGELWGGELRDRLWQANRELNQILRESADERRARALQPCRCGGTEFRLSEELALGEIVVSGNVVRGPLFRLLLCPRCGRTEWLAAEVEKLLARPLFTETIEVGGGAR